MALEFMTGATVFALINLFFLAIVVWLIYRIVSKIHKFIMDDSNDKTVNYKYELIGLGLIVILFTFFGSVTQPKLKIDVPENRALIEYQDQTPEVVIETPPPRTEKLDGFTPLKE